MAIIYRIGNGSPLTYTQVDDNFLFLLSNMSGSVVSISGSVQVTGSISVLPEGTINQLTSSWAISSSRAVTSVTSSHAVTALTSSFSLTASYAAGGGSTPNFQQVTDQGATTTNDITVNGDVTVNGTASISFLHTTYESASIIYSSGSTKFGDSMDDTHQRTGSLLTTGSTTQTGDIELTGKINASGHVTASFFKGDGSGLTNVTGEWDGSRDGDASITGSLSVGYPNNTDGFRAFAQGTGNNASGDSSHAQGEHTTASSGKAHSEGSFTRAGGYASHAEGYYTFTNTGQYNHVEGLYTTASGVGAHAEGSGSKAAGNYSHAQGEKTDAAALGSFASGLESKAAGEYGFTHGYQVTSSLIYSTAVGRFNEGVPTNQSSSFVVGTGVSATSRVNAFEVGFVRNGGSNRPYITLPMAYKGDGGGEAALASSSYGSIAPKGTMFFKSGSSGNALYIYDGVNWYTSSMGKVV